LGNIAFDNGGKFDVFPAHNHYYKTRAATYDAVHILEAAFCDPKIIAAAKQLVPPNGILVQESTGNGDNHFMSEWLRATYGISEYTPIFIPWLENEWCVMPLNLLEVLDYDEDEQMLRTLFNLSDEQLKWRRWAIVNHCDGDVDVFRREYPSFPEEAFGLKVTLA
jgi:hypothetical protein